MPDNKIHALIQAALAGEEKAFESLLNRYQRGVYNIIYQMIKNREETEDLVQETLLAAIRAKESFAGRSTVRTWLFGILKHKIIDHIRKISRERPQEDIESFRNLSGDIFDEQGGWKAGPAEWTTDPALLFQQKEFWEMLQNCLTELPFRLQQAFTLRELDGLRAEEVRKILQVSATNGGVMLHRARMRLRDCLTIKWFDND